MTFSPNPPCPENMTFEEEWDGRFLELNDPEAYVLLSGIDDGEKKFKMEGDLIEASWPTLEVAGVAVICRSKGLCTDAVTSLVQRWRIKKGFEGGAPQFVAWLTFAARDHEMAGCVCYLQAMMVSHSLKNLYLYPYGGGDLMKIFTLEDGQGQNGIVNFCKSNFDNDQPRSSPIYAKQWLFGP